MKKILYFIVFFCYVFGCILSYASPVLFSQSYELKELAKKELNFVQNLIFAQSLKISDKYFRQNENQGQIEFTLWEKFIFWLFRTFVEKTYRNIKIIKDFNENNENENISTAAETLKFISLHKKIGDVFKKLETLYQMEALDDIKNMTNAIQVILNEITSSIYDKIKEIINTEAKSLYEEANQNQGLTENTRYTFLINFIASITFSSIDTDTDTNQLN